MDGRKPCVDIALATYNGSRYLDAFLDSLAAQTWPSLRVIASDNCSTDETPNILRKFDKLPMTIIINHDRGIVENFSSAIGAATADYVALADQDDVWEHEKIERLMKRMLEIEARQGSGRPTLVI